VHIAAILVWSFAFFKSKVQEERKARIERVNEQVKAACE